MKSALTSILLPVALAQFDFGGGGDGGDCSGSGTFQQPIPEGESVFVGEIPSGIRGLEITSTSDVDVDIQLKSGNDFVIDWQHGVFYKGKQESKAYNGDRITYSGYNGDGTGFGNEFVRFGHKRASNNPYTMLVYGYEEGIAQIDYSWAGRDDCNGGQDQSGSGSFEQVIDQSAEVDVGTLPAGISDVFVSLSSSADIDILLYQGETKIVHWQGGVLKDHNFGETTFNGLNIQYSGYNGGQSDNRYGEEYVLISGEIQDDIQLKVLGYSKGVAQVNYSWGYYAEVMPNDSGETLKTKLHTAVSEGHTEQTYNKAIQSLRLVDQDDNAPTKLLTLYSRQKLIKATLKPNGSGRVVADGVWPSTRGDFGKGPGAGTDLHNLRATLKTVANARNGKSDFSVGGTSMGGDCSLCKFTSTAMEAPDAVKGQVARTIFYMATRYNGDTGSNGVDLSVTDNASGAEMGTLSVLKAWNNAFPPSDQEKNRNNLVYIRQGNRNPFVDHPEWANAIFEENHS